MEERMIEKKLMNFLDELKKVTQQEIDAVELPEVPKRIDILCIIDNVELKQLYVMMVKRQEESLIVIRSLEKQHNDSNLVDERKKYLRMIDEEKAKYLIGITWMDDLFWGTIRENYKIEKGNSAIVQTSGDKDWKLVEFIPIQNLIIKGCKFCP